MQSCRQLVEGIVQVAGQEALVAQDLEKDWYRDAGLVRPSPLVANRPQGAFEGVVGVGDGVLHFAGPVVGVRAQELVSRPFKPGFVEVSNPLYSLRCDDVMADMA